MVDEQIRQLIASYLSNEIDASRLENALEDIAWATEHEPARSLVNSALIVLNEFENGDWSEDEIRPQLDKIVHTYWIDQGPAHIRTGTSAGVIRKDRSSAALGRWPAAASV